MKGKNKLVPRLLGITKESVMRVDEKTKEVLQEWPLTTVKRWAASPKSFTLVIRGGESEAEEKPPNLGVPALMQIVLCLPLGFWGIPRELLLGTDH